MTEANETFIGVHLAHQIATGVVSGDYVLAEPLRTLRMHGAMSSLPVEDIVQAIVGELDHLEISRPVEAIGMGVPGLVRGGIVDESPNLPQLKGFSLGSHLYTALLPTPLHGVPVFVVNDADALAAGIASQRKDLRRPVRVWTLGRGVGFGCYPPLDEVGEGGHIAVTLDPNENHCSCGGRGHLEGIVGLRSMRRRFLDKEPEQVFEAAKNGDEQAHAFVMLWHRALAAATASCIHLDGPGEFFISGAGSRFVNIGLLTQQLDGMVGMPSLQGSTFTVVSQTEHVGVLGAAVSASHGALAQALRLKCA